jgi:hypothetical protein
MISFASMQEGGCGKVMESQDQRTYGGVRQMMPLQHAERCKLVQVYYQSPLQRKDEREEEKDCKDQECWNLKGESSLRSGID